VDSQETQCYNGKAANAIDGNASTMWHTQFCGATPSTPHEIQINLGASYLLSAFQYLPRQDGCSNGWIKQYEFYVSSDGVNWGTPVASGTFNYGNLSTTCPGAGVPSALQVGFPAITGQYIRLRALSEINGHPWTTAAEIGVLAPTLAFGSQLVDTSSAPRRFVLANTGATAGDCERQRHVHSRQSQHHLSWRRRARGSRGCIPGNHRIVHPFAGAVGDQWQSPGHQRPNQRARAVKRYTHLIETIQFGNAESNYCGAAHSPRPSRA
jgi:hypothetical protein